MISFFEGFNANLFDLLGTVSVFIPFALCVGLFFAAIYVTVAYFRR